MKEMLRTGNAPENFKGPILELKAGAKLADTYGKNNIIFQKVTGPGIKPGKIDILVNQNGKVIAYECKNKDSMRLNGQVRIPVKKRIF